MEGILANWQKEKSDPLLSGPLPAPEDVLISDVDDFSADDVGGKY